MNPLFDARSIKQQFALLLGGILSALLVLALWCFYEVSEIAVNGALYQRILLGEKLEADVLPPPQYIVESFLLVGQLRSAEPAERAPLIARLGQRQHELLAGQEAWRRSALPAALKEQVNGAVFTPAQAFFNEVYAGYLPALASHDAAGIRASYLRLSAFYEAHRAAVDRLVAALAPYRQRIEAEAKLTITRSLVGTGVLALLLLAAVVALVLRQLGVTMERTLQQQAALIEANERARAAAEAANRSKSEFFASMSHELRTPMNAIIGMTHLALNTAMTPKQSDYLGKIRSASDSLLALINDILDVSKIEAGRFELELRPFKIAELLQHVETIIEVRAREKGVTLRLDGGETQGLSFIGDRLRLEQVLINLCSNGVKFTPAGGSVQLGIAVQAREAGRWRLRFVVRDTGVGLSALTATELFQPFRQADSSIARRYGGTGLGLAISRQLVELMGGEIGVNVQVVPGAEFWFQLTLALADPFDAAAPALDSEALLLDTPRRALRVLVVDDNAVARQTCLELLPAIDATGVGVASAAACLELLGQPAEPPFDLLLIDWLMPEIDGVRLVELVRQRQMAKPPRLVLMTAYASDEARGLATRDRFDGFLGKPLTRAALRDTVQALFGRAAPREISALPAETMARLRGRRVLLVEDTEFNRQVAGELLGDVAGMQVSMAVDGLDALAQLAGNAMFDLVLMDVQMPVMDGLEATRRIRTEARHAALPIIAMTASALQSDREASLAAGMNAFIRKPVDPPRLFELIARWLPEPQPATDAEAIDAALGLSNCMGQGRLYRRLLRTFVDCHADDAAKLARLLDQDLLEPAGQLAHSMKSVAGTLGASALAEAAEQLMAALQSREPARIDAVRRRYLGELEAALAHARRMPVEAD